MARRAATPPPGERLRLGSADITWEQFEQFLLSLLNALPDIKSAHRYGTPGDHQDGIDHEIVYNDKATGGLQARQRQRFGKADFDEAVDDNEYAADRHIVATSAPATAPARAAVAKTPGWELWDIDDIGVQVRSLPRVDARWLVEDHLGADERRSFLGPDGGLTLARWPRRFALLLRPGLLFSHTLDLVGRDAALAALGQFASNPKQQIAILPGRGGSGKSRLLLEFARRFETDQQPILFSLEGAALTFQSLEDELPAGPSVLVIDDAHRGGNARVAIGFAASHPDVKLVLGTRPHGLDELTAVAVSSGFDRTDVLTLEPLEPLDRETSQALARLALPAGAQEVIEALGDTTRDCQLITVLAGRLLASKQIPLGLIANESELRDEVLTRFREEMIGKVPDTVPRDKLRRLLPIVAAVQPVRDNEHNLLESIASSSGCIEHEVVGWLSELERAGLLLRAGGLRRFTPDVLGDFVLEAECVDEHGRPSGYAEWLWESFADMAATRLVVNLSELDWRLRASAGASTLFAPVWSRLRAEYEGGDAFVRSQLLGLIEPVAIMHPERLLAIADLELSAPATTHTDEMFGAAWTGENVKHKLAPLIKNAGLHPQHTARAMRLLWALGRDDKRPQPQNPDHGLRLLAELGGYERGHSFFSRTLLDTVEAQLADPNGAGATAIQLLGPLLARQVTVTGGSRLRITLHEQFVDRKGTADIRQATIAILRDAALAGGDRCVAAVDVINGALRPPIGLGGQVVPKPIVDQWRPEQLELLGLLEEVLATGPEASIAGQIRETLEQERQFSRWPVSRKRAKQILERYAPDANDELVEAIERPWSRALGDSDHRRKEVARRFAADHHDADSAAATLNAVIGQARADSTNPMPLLADIADQAPELADALFERGIAHPDEPLTPGLGAFLRHREPGLTSRLWNSGHTTLRRLAASAYARYPGDLDADDTRRLREMLGDPDFAVREHARQTVARLNQLNSPLTLELAAAAPPPETDHELDHLLHGLNIAEATEDQLAVFLGWIESLERLSWEAGEFIKKAAPYAPDRVVELLIARARDGRDIVATTQLSGLFDGLSAQTYAVAVLTLLEAALDPELAWRLGYLAEPIARGDYSELVALLVDWLVAADRERVQAACSFVSELPSPVVFDHHAAFASALERTAPEHVDRVRRALFAASHSGVTTRGHGRPADADVTRLERSLDIARALPNDSRGQTFFAGLASSFRENIEADLRRDEEEDTFGH
jgi:hypothetical protein